MGLPRQFYRRTGGGFLCLAQEGLEDFVGDAIATSTNRRLEGTFRRNWWGFAGRKSADAALHEKAGPALLQACRKHSSELPFGVVLVTAAGPNLQVRHVLHTAVPSHPSGRDPRPLPPAQESDFAEAPEAALRALAAAYAALLQQAAKLGAESLACPAIGAGCRGYPLEATAQIGLDALARADPVVPYIEVRFWAHAAFIAWRDECARIGLASCEETEVADCLWEGEPLATWYERRKREASASSCTLM
eukprot:gnl/TRDRNA2_/TRDRNA2_93059_c0_seq2.p1 gnl/TRDRNA2_/TRDRNA2_93059_c0~~gnl/TRDRNA2_/TRDRNA2_93059_c0_seq2.p1  ORF type:complete len:248 (+),score=42.02 gnl/TRDRNA2_/TRDRNA2_93059_c0_seq2:37-780(+)